nr:bifunctional diguanylate cyclase/phosphodiesterase [Gammaproteobacteria bacterium]
AGRTGTYAAILFLDLDGFKRVNDSLGHETGDQLLKQSAQRLTESLRDGDTVCRLGGDEFIVLLSGLKLAADAHAVAENLVSQFRGPFILDERELVVTVSIGIAIYPDDGSSTAELLRNADTAMYHSKEQGRNTYHYFTEAMNKDVSRRLAVEEQLHGALDRQEFSVLFQPIVSLTTGKVVGAEALLRWANPALGDVSPEEFIPIAEQTGSIVEIGYYVLNLALSCSRQWQAASTEGFKMAVNLSPRQFRDPGLADSIKGILDQFNLAPDTLELEITEGVLLSGHVNLDNALSLLNTVGVGIAMDDFGTGYSSLSYLRSYPFNILKIDRSFISDIAVDQADRELVNAAILMAHGLGLKVVAEGVETAEQLDYLRDRGCEFAQGYLFNRPVTSEEFSKLIKLKPVVS